MFLKLTEIWDEASIIRHNIYAEVLARLQSDPVEVWVSVMDNENWLSSPCPPVFRTSVVKRREEKTHPDPGILNPKSKV